MTKKGPRIRLTTKIPPPLRFDRLGASTTIARTPRDSLLLPIGYKLTFPSGKECKWVVRTLSVMEVVKGGRA